MNDDVYQVIFTIAEALELPVVILSLVALALVLYEVGAFLVETRHRRRRRLALLTTAATAARRELDAGSPDAARTALAGIAWSDSMRATLAAFVAADGDESLIAKHLADFDFGRQRRLGRTRLLVRVGPALGLMGTLIPLSPALEGLADGDVQALTDNLRVAFSITVLGLLVGAIAFALSLARDRIYGQDYSDLEYVAAVLTAPANNPSVTS